MSSLTSFISSRTCNITMFISFKYFLHGNIKSGLFLLWLPYQWYFDNSVNRLKLTWIHYRALCLVKLYQTITNTVYLWSVVLSKPHYFMIVCVMRLNAKKSRCAEAEDDIQQFCCLFSNYTVIISTATKRLSFFSGKIALYWLQWTFNAIVMYRHSILSVMQPKNMPKKLKNDM